MRVSVDECANQLQYGTRVRVVSQPHFFCRVPAFMGGRVNGVSCVRRVTPILITAPHGGPHGGPPRDGASPRVTIMHQ